MHYLQTNYYSKYNLRYIADLFLKIKLGFIYLLLQNNVKKKKTVIIKFDRI